jgi:hypothetical protein
MPLEKRVETAERRKGWILQGKSVDTQRIVLQNGKFRSIKEKGDA